MSDTLTARDRARENRRLRVRTRRDRSETPTPDGAPPPRAEADATPALEAANAAAVHVTVCATCADTNVSGEAGLGGGGALYRALQDGLIDHPYAPRIHLKTQRCLMACTAGCAVTVAARGKMQYVLARLPATADMAAQVLDFAALYSDAPTGVTPNHEWPGRIALHFLARVPPVDPVEGDWTQDGCDL